MSAASAAARRPRHASGCGQPLATARRVAVVVAVDLGPADVAELDDERAIALAAGGTTAHAAIVARGLGLPMVVGVGPDLCWTSRGVRWSWTATPAPLWSRRTDA